VEGNPISKSKGKTKLIDRTAKPAFREKTEQGDVRKEEKRGALSAAGFWIVAGSGG
jgi:hypothetical protein